MPTKPVAVRSRLQQGQIASALSDALNEANVDQLSVREIARRGGDRVHHSALGKYLKPTHGRPGEDVLEVFSEVLRIPMPRLRQLAGMPAGDRQPYEPPREANRLDMRQRKLVNELIRMLAEAKVGDDNVDRDPAPMKPAPAESGLSEEERERAREAARAAGRAASSTDREPPMEDKSTA